MGAQENRAFNDIGKGYSLSDIDDLTHFGDEAFSTDEVDLIEVGGGDESPLARLKTIVLSLDWEISESNLRDLADEAQGLQQTWSGSPLASIYLQGLEKLSRYIQEAQSNTHPNAIKLLQIFYCNLERLLVGGGSVSEELQGMVREDVRRFRILTYQVSGGQETGKPDLSGGLLETKDAVAVQLHRLKGLVLGIDWEVTDQVLQDLEQEVARLRGEGLGGPLVALLFQGMDALIRYMRQAGSQTHAAAFSVLYAMYDGIEQMLERPDMPEPEAQALVLDLGERFEGLKLAVVKSQTSTEQQEAFPAAPEGPVTNLGTTPHPPAAESRHTGAAATLSAGVAGAVLGGVMAEAGRLVPPGASPQDTMAPSLNLDDDFDDVVPNGASPSPALAAVPMSESAFGAFAEPAPADPLAGELESQLDAFFEADGPAAPASGGGELAFASAPFTIAPELNLDGIDTSPIQGMSLPQNDGLSLDLDDQMEMSAAGTESLAPALTDVPSQEVERPVSLDLPGAETLALNDRLDELFGESPPPPPALAGVDVPATAEEGMAVPAPDDGIADELSEQLDAFFASDSAGFGNDSFGLDGFPAGSTRPPETASPALMPAEIETLTLDLDDQLHDDNKTSAHYAPALADTPTLTGGAVPPPAPAFGESSLAGELDERFDAMFSASGPEADVAGAMASPLSLDDDEVSPAGFAFSGEDDGIFAPALVDAEPFGEHEGAMSRLGGDLCSVTAPPSAELVHTWQSQTQTLLNELPPADDRRVSLLLLDTVLAALSASGTPETTAAPVLAGIGRSLSSGRGGDNAAAQAHVLEQYLAWQKDFNLGLVTRR